MLKVGVLGLGGIAQKAYLPVFAGLQDQVDWYLCTRNQAKLDQLQQQYQFAHSLTNATQLAAEPLDAVFIHTPTATHGQYVRQFLEAGINVYVDKPVSEDFTEVQALYDLAAQKHLLLTAGFNRRFAPLNQQLHQQAAQSNQIVVQKNRQNNLGPVKYMVFDLMSHVVDTAVYLADLTTADLAQTTYQLNVIDAKLQRARVLLDTPRRTIFANMNLQAGSNTETAELQGPSGIWQVQDLARLTQQQGPMQQQTVLSDWTPTLEQRGFAPLIKAFLTAVAQGTANPVSPTSSLLTHQICTQLWQSAGSAD
jgi:virulence factor